MSNVILCKPAGLKMLVLVVSTLIVNGRTSGQEDLLARITTEWQASEVRFESVRCKWKEDITYMPGSAMFPLHPVITRLPAATPKRNELLLQGWPMEATNLSGERLVILKGNWLRYEEPILSFTPSDPRIVRQVTNKSSFDGEQAITLSVDGEFGRLAKH